MVQEFSQEFRLLAACSAWPPSECRTQLIRDSAPTPMKWQDLPRLVRRHRVAALVHDGLTRAKLKIPSEIRREIAAEAKTMAEQNLLFAAEALRLQQQF